MKISIFDFRCDSVDKLRNKMPSLEQEIQDPNRFKEFYQFCFNYGKANNPGQKGKKYIFSKYIYLFEIILESIILIYFRCGHRCCISLLEPHTPRKISTPWYMDNICQGNLNLTISQHTYKSLTQGISWQNDIFHTTTLILQHYVE